MNAQTDPKYCWKCGGDSRVYNTYVNHGSIVRQRKCLNCFIFWHTEERVIPSPSRKGGKKCNHTFTPS